jgi:Flp pilus assembly pilin Flp
MRYGVVAFSAKCRDLRSFFRADDGIATIEWVVLAGAMVIGTIGVAYIIMAGLAGAASGIASQLSP